MAEINDIPTLRVLLAKFLPDQRLVKAFENLGDTAKEGFITAEAAYTLAGVAKGIAEAALALAELIQAAEYVTLSANATLENERVLTAGNLIALADGGAGAGVTVDVDRLTISGTDDLDITLTAPTALTLPTTGTLATLAGVEQLDNKTLDTLRIDDPFTGGTPTVTGSIPVQTASGTKYVMLANAP